VLAELQIGWLRAHGRSERQIGRFDELRSILTFLPVTQATVSRYVQIRWGLEFANAIIPENDMWIAATALEHELPILTTDAHFSRVGGIQVIHPAAPAS